MICKLTQLNKSFQEIIKNYRSQPQAKSDIYREVLLNGKKTKTVDGASVVVQDKGDLIQFYNTVFIQAMKRFAEKFMDRGDEHIGDILLSPLPASRGQVVQVYDNISIKPLESPTSSFVSGKVLSYFFSRSPSKDLKDINKAIKDGVVLLLFALSRLRPRLARPKRGEHLLHSSLFNEKPAAAPTSTQEDQKPEVAAEENKDVKENGTGEAEPVAEQEKEAPKEMRAVVLTGFGGLKSVKILKKPEPTVNEGELLIRVKACGLNFQDLMVRQGAIDSPPKCPFILGFECAGEIEQVGEGVEGFSVGDQVVALPEYRAWAELVAVPAKYVFKLPKDVSHLDAATITMNYTVAYILLFELAGLSKGKSILVHSVGGGVGQECGSPVVVRRLVVISEYNSILTFMEVVLCFLVMPTDMVNESGTWRRAASCVRVIMKRRLRRRPQQQVVGVCTGVFPVCVTGAATASPSLAALRFILIRTRGASRRRSAMSRPHHMDGQRLRSPLKLIHGNSSVSLRPAKTITGFFQMVFATETLCFQYRRDKNLYEPLGVIYAAMKCTYDTEEQCRRSAHGTFAARRGSATFRDLPKLVTPFCHQIPLNRTQKEEDTYFRRRRRTRDRRRRGVGVTIGKRSDAARRRRRTSGTVAAVEISDRKDLNTLYKFGNLISVNRIFIKDYKGQAVVQLAKTVPDVTIFGICSKGKHEALKNAQSPVDHLLERGSDYSSEIRKISPDGVDIVLDCLCGEECNKGYSLLKPMGRYILYGSSNVVTGETKSFFSAARSWWQVDKVSPLKLFDENRTLSGFNLRRLLFQQGGTEFVEKAVQKVFSLLQEKKIKPLLDSTWALEDVAEAMQKMHDRKNVGKLILDPSLEPKPKPATPAKGKSKEDKKKQSSEEKKEDEKKEEEKKEEKKDEQLTNGDSAGDSDSKEKEGSS
ncbi:hypothetical protein GEV33_014167 [Tenebrio molitor]|uniref:Enoyl reductase (ER) domain-containing protein n=1 Tax=Tenebrio molitor TaxID=7067 RepID=A0A8J6H7D6_TENMO|nr:hypothetical protein GEV33_014167 [Tenebrio molitor]